MEFSEIALLKLTQVIPELVSYIVSFADITDQTLEQEDSSLRVGCFLVSFGNSYYYIPIINKGDSIQPMDSIFSAENQTFLPLTKRIVNNLIDSAKNTIGKASRIPNTVVKNPSVHHLVTPPRTGKFVYASASRVVDFLGSMPNMTKKAVLQKFSEDKSVYSALHKLFGLEHLFGALRPTEETSAVEKTPHQGIHIVTEGKGLPEDMIQDILSKGYASVGNQASTRVALEAFNYNDFGALRQLSSSDAGKDYTIYNSDGFEMDAFIPKKSKANPTFPALLNSSHGKSSDPVFAIFRDASFAISSNMISRADGSAGKEVIKELIQGNYNVSPSQVAQGTPFALFSPDFELIGAYVSYKVNNAGYGTTIIASPLIRGYREPAKTVTINAFKNVTAISGNYQTELFVPFGTVCIPLGKDLSCNIGNNINAVARKLDFITRTTLGSSAELGYDGVEYNYNGAPVGGQVDVIKVLVLKEGLAPNLAESFVKKAKENGHVKFYMSKAADFTPSEIPQYGQSAPQQYNPLDIQGPDFMGSVQAAIQTNDSSTVESTIISELLQTTDMAEHIMEYLPDIDSAVDKLGRTLFLIRLNIGKLGDKYEASELLSFVSNLRNVYRLLGENSLKLAQMSHVDFSDAQGKA